MIYLKSKYISKKLGINLAKWKRWSREFLAPDPLGGYQSGYARQFSKKEAFRVFIGGYLVSYMKFSIPEACQILEDLNGWFKKKRFYSLSLEKHPTFSEKDHHIYIYRLDEGRFGYAIRSMTGRFIQKDGPVWQERFEFQFIGISEKFVTENKFTHAYIIYIDYLHHEFLSMINMQ